MWGIYLFDVLMKVQHQEPCLETWMGCKAAKESEVSQKEENKYFYINAYMRSLEKWCGGTCLQSRNRDTGRKQVYGHPGGKWG